MIVPPSGGNAASGAGESDGHVHRLAASGRFNLSERERADIRSIVARYAKQGTSPTESDLEGMKQQIDAILAARGNEGRSGVDASAPRADAQSGAGERPLDILA